MGERLPRELDGRLRDGLLSGEIFYKLPEAKILIGNRRREYSEIRPHGSLGYKPPAPQTRMLIHAFALAGAMVE
jgi:putative transposase